MDELLHLDAPRAADTPEDGSDDLGRFRGARIDPLRACGILEMLPGPRTSGKSCQGRDSVGGCDFLRMQRGPVLRRDLESLTKKKAADLSIRRP
jgi:hypothetical protein